MKKKKKVLIIILAILVFLGLIYLGVSIFVDSMLNKTTIEEIEPEEIEVVEDPTPQAHEVVNFMVVGADNLDADRMNSYTEERSDVFKILSLDYTDKVIKLISLDRDVVVWIPDKNETGEFGRFNWAYSFGGGKYAINTINYNLDLDVSKFVAFSFKGFRDVIDAIGGVDIRLTDAEAKNLNSGGHTMTCIEGDNHLDGYTALNFARIRHLDSDFVRMDRQNVVINAVIKKFRDSSATELFDVVNSCLPYITTNLTNSEIKNYLFDIVGFDLKNIKTQTYPLKEEDDVCWNKNSSLGGYLLRSYSDQVIDLHKFIYGTQDYEPSKTIYENEKKTYETFGDFYEGSELIP